MSWRNPPVAKCKQLLTPSLDGHETLISDRAAQMLMGGQMVSAPGGLPAYWSENPNLVLASQVEPTKEEKEAKLYQEMVALGMGSDPQARVIGRIDGSSQVVVPGAIALSYLRGSGKERA